jgi:hypothetical protein
MSCSGKIPGIVGADLSDADSELHPGLLTRPIPVLSSTAEGLREIKSASKKYSGLEVTGFSDVAQKSKTYGSYTEKLSCTRSSHIKYLGLCIFGNEESVKSLTGSLPLIR